MKHLPRTGLLTLDCRNLGAEEAALRVRLLVRKLRHARHLRVLGDDPLAIRGVRMWARAQRVPHETVRTTEGWCVHLYLLPEDFGSPPRVAIGEIRPMRTGSSA